jgi:hypothetical protein
MVFTMFSGFLIYIGYMIGYDQGIMDAMEILLPQLSGPKEWEA